MDGYGVTEVLKSEDIDLVITDLRMPNTEGAEVVKRIREVNADVPVIVLSGYAERYRKDALAAGAVEVFAKPLGANELVPSIRKYLAEFKVV